MTVDEYKEKWFDIFTMQVYMMMLFIDIYILQVYMMTSVLKTTVRNAYQCEKSAKLVKRVGLISLSNCVDTLMTIKRRS